MLCQRIFHDEVQGTIRFAKFRFKHVDFRAALVCEQVSIN